MDARRNAEESVVDLMTEGLMRGREDSVRRVFNDNGGREPVIIWSPHPEELEHPQLRRFAEICRGLEGPSGQVSEKAFDQQEFGTLTPWIMRLVPDGDEYRYIYYGQGIADHYGRDMTGKTTADFTGHIAEFFKALYRASGNLGKAVISEHEPPSGVFVRTWRRLIIPLVDETGDTVVSFAAINLPENELRAGLELVIDPVFVLDAEHRVKYANRSAKKLFGTLERQMQNAQFRDVTDISLELPLSPGEMLAQGAVDDSVQLTLRNGIAERLVTTVSAAEHRGHAFYVVILRLIGT